MEIGKPQRTIIVEPIENPIRKITPAPAEPEREAPALPAAPDKERQREPVPA